MAESPQMAQPTSEHEKLKEAVGTWRVDCTFFMDPSQPPMKVVATEEIKMMGPFWTRSIFKADMGGVDFEGSSTLGYDPSKGKWVSTWIDSMNPGLFVFTGDFDDDAGVLEMTGEGPSPMSPEPATYRTVEKHLGPNERTLDMYLTLPTGDEMQMFTYTYTREG